MKIEVGKYYHVTQKDSVAYISNLLIDKSTGKKIYQGNLYEGTNCSISQWDQDGINLKINPDHLTYNLNCEIEDPIGYIFQRVLLLRESLNSFEKATKTWMVDQSTIIHNTQYVVDKIEKWSYYLVEKLNGKRWFSQPFRKF